MSGVSDALGVRDADQRTSCIVDTLVEAFADLMAAEPAAFRAKFRKMAADPFAFYRGSDCLFYADLARLEDPWVDERTRRVWIQGDLHAENFGTYMDGSGALIFDVNDFDEAYLGHFTWDVQRLAASVALLGWRKALSDESIDELVGGYAQAYLDQVRAFVEAESDQDFSLRLASTDGTVHQVLQRAKLRTRVMLLNELTETEGFDRRFRDGPRTARGCAGSTRTRRRRCARRSTATWRPFRRASGFVRSPTPSKTWSGAAGSASAAPGCPPTTC